MSQDNDTYTTEDYYNECISEGYVYECSCGEVYDNLDYAIRCRKCRTYAEEGHCTEVIDINHGGLVWTSDVVSNWELELLGAQGKWPTLASIWN